MILLQPKFHDHHFHLPLCLFQSALSSIPIVSTLQDLLTTVRTIMLPGKTQSLSVTTPLLIPLPMIMVIKLLPLTVSDV